MRILIVSDIHYACDREKARVDFRTAGISNPLTRFLVGTWSDWLWEGDPFARNDAFERFLARDFYADLVVANGDYTADTAFIGIADSAAHESALHVMTQLEQRFGKQLKGIIGDHELGKISPDGGRGGMRLDALHASHNLPAVSSQWSQHTERLSLIGVNSTLIALPVLERDMLPSEKQDWLRHSAEHIDWIRSTFENLPSEQRIVLFCHDPTALPYLHRIPEIRKRLHQIQHTVIGHLHSDWILNTANQLTWFPRIHQLGAGVQRVSQGLNESRCWRDFNLLFCPALDGIRWHKGASLILDINPLNPRQSKVTRIVI